MPSSQQFERCLIVVRVAALQTEVVSRRIRGHVLELTMIGTNKMKDIEGQVKIGQVCVRWKYWVHCKRNVILVECGYTGLSIVLRLVKTTTAVISTRFSDSGVLIELVWCNKSIRGV